LADRNIDIMTGNDGDVYVINRPHIQRILRSSLLRFVFKILQDLVWTFERVFSINRSLRNGDHVELLELKDLSNPVIDPYFVIEGNRDFLLNVSGTIYKDIGKFSSLKTIVVVTPTRFTKLKKDADGYEYSIQKSIDSVERQGCASAVHIKFIIGVDVDAVVPDFILSRCDVVIARSSGNSQILALNAAIDKIDGQYDYVAFLEDDDWWHPDYLYWALLALEHYDFVSSSQLSVDEDGRILTIFDYPTPSGWLVSTNTLLNVGPVNPESKWHYDNEWLGRLSNLGIRRCHLVECTAPTSFGTAEWRPGIRNIISNGGPRIEIQRHNLAFPLVYRLVHSQSGTAAVKVDERAGKESEEEYKWLISKYGRIPW